MSTMLNGIEGEMEREGGGHTIRTSDCVFVNLVNKTHPLVFYC